MNTNYPILTKHNAVIGNKYASAGDGYITLNRIYRITEQQAAENWLSCLDRYEAVTNKGDTLSTLHSLIATYSTLTAGANQSPAPEVTRAFSPARLMHPQRKICNLHKSTTYIFTTILVVSC